jgi:hypothetical protein
VELLESCNWYEAIPVILIITKRYSGVLRLARMHGPRGIIECFRIRQVTQRCEIIPISRCRESECESAKRE